MENIHILLFMWVYLKIFDKIYNPKETWLLDLNFLFIS